MCELIEIDNENESTGDDMMEVYPADYQEWLDKADSEIKSYQEPPF